MRIIVINLDRDTERRARIGHRLHELGLRWERLSAVDGSGLDSSHEALVDRAAHAPRELRFSPGEIGYMRPRSSPGARRDRQRRQREVPSRRCP